MAARRRDKITSKMLRVRSAGLASFVLWAALALAVSLPVAGCGSGGSSGSPSGGSGGTGGAAGASGSDAGPVCGDGIVNGNEECDNGPNNGPGSGCELDCRFSCHTNADCNDSDPCNGVETCQSVKGGRACKPGIPPAEGSACGTGGYCKNGVCTQPVCGNGIVEPGEDCEPPNTSTCSADCKTVVCGDGVIGGTEQCDDGNTTNLDGCDSSCRYETQMRFTSLDFSRDPAPAFCAHNNNAMGEAISTEVIQAFNDNIQNSINGGAFNGILTFGGLDDLTGTNAASIKLGLLSASLDPAYPGTWSPSAVDEWYLADADMIDAQGIPTSFLSPASIQSHVLTAGPNSLFVRLVVNTTTTQFDTRDTKIRATVDTSPAPDVPAPPPSKIAPGLEVFRSLTATGPDQGLCGVTTVASLAKVALPQDFCLGPNVCQPSSVCSGSRTYGCGDSLLDVIVGGCKVTSLCVQAVAPTQPDVGTNGNPPVPLAFDANNQVVPSVPTDGYTFLIHFKAARAHLTNNMP